VTTKGKRPKATAEKTPGQKAAEVARFVGLVISGMPMPGVWNVDARIARMHALIPGTPGEKEKDLVRVAEVVARTVAPSPFWEREPYAKLSAKEKTRAVTWLATELLRIDSAFARLPRRPLRALLASFNPRRVPGGRSVARLAAEIVVDAGALGERVHARDGGPDGAVTRVRRRVEQALKKHPIAET
jgi:hypothetical protein